MRPWGAVLHSRLRLLHLSLRACPAWRPRPQPAPHAAHGGAPKSSLAARGTRWEVGLGVGPPAKLLPPRRRKAPLSAP